MDARTRGALGEVRAEQMLTEKGYRILARNAVFHGSEIDLIAEDGRVIVFIEVKMRRSAREGAGREAVTPAKQKKICKGALYYLAKNGLMDRQARFDVVEVQPGGILHIENAFVYQGPAF